MSKVSADYHNNPRSGRGTVVSSGTDNEGI